MRLILFDIDGTLLLSGGAGTRALARAVEEVCGLADAMAGVQPDGKTDPQIIREALERAGHGDRGLDMERLYESYLIFLERELESAELRVLPGVRELIFELERRPGIVLGVATGNIERGARLKLQKAELDSCFGFGGFGSDAEERTELIRIAIQRGLERERERAGTVFMVGDTPRDINHGSLAGARTLAVATGSYSLEELEQAGADLALPALKPVQPALDFLLRWEPVPARAKW